MGREEKRKRQCEYIQNAVKKSLTNTHEVIRHYEPTYEVCTRIPTHPIVTNENYDDIYEDYITNIVNTYVPTESTAETYIYKNCEFLHPSHILRYRKAHLTKNGWI
jgi:hypothetical protein